MLLNAAYIQSLPFTNCPLATQTHVKL